MKRVDKVEVTGDEQRCWEATSLATISFLFLWLEEKFTELSFCRVPRLAGGGLRRRRRRSSLEREH